MPDPTLPERYEEYKQAISSDIRTVLDEANVQPVLFVGTGVSRRYFTAPSWNELLQRMTELCVTLDRPYGYYRQTRTPPEMGQFLAEAFQEAAWTVQTDEFDGYTDHFDHPPDIYLKYKVSEYIDSLTPDSIDQIDEQRIASQLSIEEARDELRQLQTIQPHAIITTNYDEFLHTLYPDYHVSVGEEVFVGNYWLIGEILKIHGDVSDPPSLILTSQDYDQFNERRRYLSSKILTYILEHPMLILGYSVGDPNIQQVFSWVAQALPEDHAIAEDIYFVEWKRNIDEDTLLRREKQISTGKQTSITVKAITASSWDWIFEAFASAGPNNIDMSLYRKLMAATYDVICERASDETAEIDYAQLERLANDRDELAAVLGIGPDSEESMGRADDASEEDDEDGDE